MTSSSHRAPAKKPRTAQFLFGYPQTQEERDQTRAVIQSNASRIRWRKGTSSAPSTTAATQEPDEFHRVSHGSRTEERIVAINRRPTAEALSIDPQAEFVETLDSLRLPPFLLLGDDELMPKDQTWVMLQKVWVVLQQAYPSNIPGSNPMASATMDRVISSNVVFLAYMFSQTMRNQHIEGASPRSRRLALEYHSRTVQAVNENLSNPDTACTEDNLLAVCNLAMHKMFTDRHSGHDSNLGPTQGPLNSLRFLSLYGGEVEREEVHFAGLMKMVKLRGGLGTLGLQGFGSSILLLEMMEASKVLRQPRTVFAASFDFDIGTSLLANRRPDHPLCQMGTDFSALKNLDSSFYTDTLQLSLENLALYSLGVDDYITGRSARASLAILADQRSYVHYALLCLIPAEDYGNRLPHSPIATICHLAGLVYSFLCCFPMPAAPFGKLVKSIEHQLKAYNWTEEWDKAPRLLVWVLYVTGIAAVETRDRTWVVSTLDRCLRRLKIETWKELKILLSKHLWLPATNDFDGIDLWKEIEESNPLGSY